MDGKNNDKGKDVGDKYKDVDWIEPTQCQGNRARHPGIQSADSKRSTTDCRTACWIPALQG